MKIIFSITIFSMLTLVACGGTSNTEAGGNKKDRMTFCECADFDDEYDSEEDQKFCENKMADWKKRMTNGDEETQQKALEEMQKCIEE